MNPVGALLLGLLLAAGFAWVRRAGPDAPLFPALALAHLSASAALGAGMTLGIVFQNAPSLLNAGGGLLVLVGLAVLIRGRPAEPEGVARRALPLRWLESFRTVPLLSVVVGVGLVTMLARVALLPLDWDGWAIWQFKAKALALGTLRDQLTDPQYAYSHPDYPLLLPTHTWWLSAGGFSEKAAQAGGLLFGLDLLVLFYWWARRHLTINGTQVGLIVLLSWPLFQKHVSSGFADVPMAAYNLALVGLVWHGRWLLAAPLLVGALLTKNEGMFTLVTTGVLGAIMAAGRRPGSGPKEAGVLLGASLIAALSWAVVKQRWQLKADLLDPSRWPADLLAESLRRAPVIGGGIAREWLRAGPHYPGWGLFWPAVIVGAALSLRKRVAATIPLWTLVAVQMAGLFAAYLLSPTPPEAHMHSSLDRLLLQVAPAALLATLVALSGETLAPGDDSRRKPNGAREAREAAPEGAAPESRGDRI